MFKAYRRIQPTTKLLVLAGILLIGVAISITYGGNPLLVGLGIVTVGVALHLFITYPHLGVAVILSLLQIGIASFISLIVGVIYTSAGLDGDYNTILGIYWSIFAVTLSWAVAYWWSRGRVWLNLIVAFAIFDVAIFILNMYGFLFVWSIMTATGASLLYLALRGIKGRVKAAAPSSKLNYTGSILPNLLKEKGYSEASLDDSHAVVATKKNNKPVYIYPLQGKKLSVEKNRLVLDDNDVTSTLEYVAHQTKTLAKQNKLPYRAFHSVVFIKADTPNDLMSIDVYSKTNPDRKLGTVVVADKSGLNRFLNISAKNDRKLSKRVTNRLAAAIQ